jgi:hypothetical protein
MTHLALRLTTRSEARITQVSCFTSNNEVRSMTHLALRLTARLEARITSTPPFREGPFGQYQAYLESVQTLHEIEAYLTH